MTPQITSGGPIIFIEDDAGKTAENHQRWKDWLWAEQRKERGEPVLNLQELLQACFELARAQREERTIAPFYSDDLKK